MARGRSRVKSRLRTSSLRDKRRGTYKSYGPNSRSCSNPTPWGLWTTHIPRGTQIVKEGVEDFPVSRKLWRFLCSAHRFPTSGGWPPTVRVPVPVGGPPRGSFPSEPPALTPPRTSTRGSGLGTLQAGLLLVLAQDRVSVQHPLSLETQQSFMHSGVLHPNRDEFKMGNRRRSLPVSPPPSPGPASRRVSRIPTSQRACL